LADVNWGDVTVGGAELFDFFLCHVKGEVLQENVVEDLPLVSFVLGAELDTDEAFEIFGFNEGFSGVLRVLEAHESVATGSMFLVEGDFAWDNASKMLEVIFKILGVFVFWNLSDEKVLRHELREVDSSEVCAVGESAAGLAFEFEVAEVLLDSLKLVGIVDSDYGRVEGLLEVAADLGLLDFDAGLALNEGGEFHWGVLVLGQVVEVDNVLLAKGHDWSLHFFCFFCF
jgi:hypothetical protein